jgi:hypothetical protein
LLEDSKCLSNRRSADLKSPGKLLLAKALTRLDFVVDDGLCEIVYDPLGETFGAFKVAT